MEGWSHFRGSAGGAEGGSHFRGSAVLKPDFLLVSCVFAMLIEHTPHIYIYNQISVQTELSIF